MKTLIECELNCSTLHNSICLFTSSAQRKELESTKLKYNEASEKLMEKNRQHQKLQVMYDALRRSDTYNVHVMYAGFHYSINVWFITLLQYVSTGVMSPWQHLTNPRKYLFLLLKDTSLILMSGNTKDQWWEECRMEE